jgi:hypothetical protein
LSQVVRIVIVLDTALLGGLTVMHRSLNSWSHHGHSGDDTLNLHVLIDKVGFEASWGHVIFTEITFEVHVVDRYLFREVDI